jgi:hypothetical protein
MNQVIKKNQKKANPTCAKLKSFLKHQLSCPFQLRVMRYHRNYFRYAEYDLDSAQARISEIEELKV